MNPFMLIPNPSASLPRDEDRLNATLAATLQDIERSYQRCKQPVPEPFASAIELAKTGELSANYTL